MAEVSLVKLPSNECHGTLLMISQHWFRKWLGAVRHQVITSDNVDPDLYHHMVSLGHNEFQCSKLSKKSCRSSCLESQIINIKLKKIFKKVPGPPPKLSASGRRTGSNLEHWVNTERSEQNGYHFADYFSTGFFLIKKYLSWLKLHWSLFQRIQQTISHYWFR